MKLALYRQGVQAYLTRDLNRLNEIIRSMDEGIARDLLNIRLLILNSDWEKAERLFLSHAVHDQTEPLLAADYHFTLGRFRYHRLDSSRQHFLKAADYYRKAQDTEGESRALINSFLDLFLDSKSIDWEEVRSSIESACQAAHNHQLVRTYALRCEVQLLLAAGRYGEITEKIEVWRETERKSVPSSREDWILFLNLIDCQLNLRQPESSARLFALLSPLVNTVDSDLAMTFRYLQWRHKIQLTERFARPDWSPHQMLESFQERSAVLLKSLRRRRLFIPPDAADEIKMWLTSQCPLPPELVHLVADHNYNAHYRVQELVSRKLQHRSGSQAERLLDLLLEKKQVKVADVIRHLGLMTEGMDSEVDFFRADSTLATLCYRINRKVGVPLLYRQKTDLCLNVYAEASESLAKSLMHDLINILEDGPIKQHRLVRRLFQVKDLDAESERSAYRQLLSLISKTKAATQKKIWIENGWVQMCG